MSGKDPSLQDIASIQRGPLLSLRTMSSSPSTNICHVFVGPRLRDCGFNGVVAHSGPARASIVLISPLFLAFGTMTPEKYLQP